MKTALYSLDGGCLSEESLPALSDVAWDALLAICILQNISVFGQYP